MTSDPIVEEVHAVRAAISARFNHDLRALCEDARRRQANSVSRLKSASKTKRERVRPATHKAG